MVALPACTARRDQATLLEIALGDFIVFKMRPVQIIPLKISQVAHVHKDFSVLLELPTLNHARLVDTITYPLKKNALNAWQGEYLVRCCS